MHRAWLTSIRTTRLAWLICQLRPRAQAYSSETGRLLDDFTLRKPVRG